MKGVKKQHLPTKICVACHRSFAWRKKWEKNWDNVKFCSQACRDGRYQSAKSAQRGGE